MPVGMVIQMFLPLTVSFLLWVSIISVKFSTKILRSEFDLPFLSTKSVVTKHSFKEGVIVSSYKIDVNPNAIKRYAAIEDPEIIDSKFQKVIANKDILPESTWETDSRGVSTTSLYRGNHFVFEVVKENEEDMNHLDEVLCERLEIEAEELNERLMKNNQFQVKPEDEGLKLMQLREFHPGYDL